MWKNLRDIGSMAEKISHVVAPSGDDDHDSYDDDEEEYEQEEEYYEEEDDDEYYEEEEQVNNRGGGGPFGLVNMLAKAMDQEQEKYDESHSNETGDADDQHQHPDVEEEEEEEEEEVYFQTAAAAAAAAAAVDPTVDAQHQLKSESTPPVAAPTAPESTISMDGDKNSFPSNNKEDLNNNNNKNAQKKNEEIPYTPAIMSSSSFAQQKIIEDDKDNQWQDNGDNNNDSSTPDDAVEPEAAVDPHQHQDHHPEPTGFSPLRRERGSVSPKRNNNRNTANNRDNNAMRLGVETPPLSGRSLGSTPSGTEVALSPLKDILAKAQQREEQEQKREAATQQNVAALAVSDPPKPGKDPLLGSFSQAEKDNIVANDFLAGRGMMRNDGGGAAETTNDNKDKDIVRGNTGRKDSGFLPNGPTNNKNSLPTVQLDSMQEGDEETTEEEEESERLSLSQQKQQQQDGSSSRGSQRDSSERQDSNAATSASSERSYADTNGIGNSLSSATGPSNDEQAKRIEKLEKRCKELKRQLMNAENHVVELQQQASNIVDQDHSEHDRLLQQFQEKESRLLEAAAQDHEQQMTALRRQMEEQITSMQRQLVEERNAFQQDRGHLDHLLNEARARAEKIERQAAEERTQNDRSASKVQQQQAHALRMAEDKLAQTLALLEERDENVNQLKGLILTMESRMNEHHEGVQEAEEEMDELHAENEALRGHAESLGAECSNLRQKVSKLEGDSEKLVHLKMELRLLKEEHNREKARVKNVAASAESSTAQLETERDTARAQVQDLQLQLSAALADGGVAKADAERIMLANSNLQAALEAFQSEREAEMALLEETRHEQEAATLATHEAALEATKDAHRVEIRQIQDACDDAVKNSMEEIKRLEEKLEMFRVENVQTRRSLDEAINRLQATQDDVVDRSFMKNILLDWLTKTEKKERGQVLELMASVLHFSDDEKSRVHLDDGGGLRKFVAPPPPKADMEHLEGDNVREKWINFLIAEAED